MTRSRITPDEEALLEELFELRHWSEPARTHALEARGKDHPAVTALARAMIEAHERLAELETPDVALLGRRMGGYRLVAAMRGGAQGSVFRGLSTADGTVAVVKVLTDPALVELFDREQRVHAQLDHPSIARFRGSGIADGYRYFVTEQVDGLAIDEHCRHYACGLVARLQLVQMLCRALEYVHDHGYVHCDVKPANVLVHAPTQVAPNGTTRLIDFGLSVALPSSAAEGRAAPGMTPGYAPPEQLRGEAVAVTHDVFAAGVLLYELLAGVPAFRQAQWQEAKLSGRYAAPVRLFEAMKADGVPAPLPGLSDALLTELDAVVHTATALEVSQRYPDVSALSAALRLIEEREINRARQGTFLVKREREVSPATALAQREIEARAEARVRLADARRKVLDDVLSELTLGSDDACGRQADILDILSRRLADPQRPLAPAARADLQAKIGEYHLGRGDFTAAEPWFERAQEGHEEALGRGCYEAAQDLYHRGIAAIETTRNTLATRHAVDALERLEPIDEATLDVYIACAVLLGQSLTNLDQHGKAIDVLVASKRMIERAAPGARDLSGILHVLATAHLRIGRYEEAERWNERSLELDKARYSAESPHVASSLLSLAAIACERGAYERAELLARNAHAINAAVCTADHPDAVSALMRWGYTLLLVGRPEEAEQALLSALDKLRARSPHEHARLALDRLAAVALHRDELSRAETFATEALAMARDLHEPSSTRLAEGLVRLAQVKLKRQEISSAEQLAREALAMLTDILPDGCLEIAYAQGELSRVLVAQADRRKLKEAVALAGHSYARLKLCDPPNPYRVAAMARVLVSAYEQLGDVAAASRFRAQA